MVNVEPFIFQKVTAFKERLQMVDKINEIIEVVNDMDIDPEQIQAMIEEALGDYYTKEEVDELFANIDFSPYYTKTEVDAIVDGVEDRIQVAEDDIDALEISKQDVLTAGDGIDITNNTVSLSDREFVPFNEWTSLMETYPNNGIKVKEDILFFFNFDAGSNRDSIYTFVPFYKNFVYKNKLIIAPMGATGGSISTGSRDNIIGHYILYPRTMYDRLVSQPSINAITAIYKEYVLLQTAVGGQYYQLSFASEGFSLNKVYYDDLNIDITNQSGFGILRRKA